ncbi:MAG: hypothetical protein KDD60_08250, partial [Bdellovibrionales bacterium]|nr:hypothetical protein [Bdellovibrionales bacterium]
VLRKLDLLKLDLILVEEPLTDGFGLALLDRVRRASGCEK